MKTSKKKIRGRDLLLDEKTNSIDYLEKAYHHIRQVRTDDYAWKWVILGLHGALYGFAICACAGSNPYTVMTRKGKPINTLKISDGKIEHVEGRLIDFNEALNRCQNPELMKKYTHSKHLELTPSQDKSIRRFHKEWRNNIEHFSPQGWGIRLDMLLNTIMDVLDVIHFLVQDTGNILFLETQSRKIKSIISRGKKILKKYQLYKETTEM